MMRLIAGMTIEVRAEVKLVPDRVKGESPSLLPWVKVSDLKTSGVSQIRPGKGDPGIGVSHVFSGATTALDPGANPQNKIVGSTSDSGASPGVGSKPSSSPAGSSTKHVPANDGFGGGLAAPKTSAEGGLKAVPHNPKPNF